MTEVREAVDALELARALIRRPSVTPADAGALNELQRALEPFGFVCERMVFEAPGTSAIDNLYARLGTGRPHFCFAGHTDVVPPGDASAWRAGPFEAALQDGMLIGRGAADMKGAIAAFVAAATRFAAQLNGQGSISLLITGDEEGPAVNGTVRMLERLAARGEKIDHCLVGEPTNANELGDTIKIGRRGSCTGRLTVRGVQGHVAYPQRADNPVPKLAEIILALSARQLDAGTEHFEPSNLEFVTADVGNPATNVIPGEARAVFNIRFNDAQNAPALEAWARSVCDSVIAARGGSYTLDWSVGGECFLTAPGPFTGVISAAITQATGRIPAMTTGGGTSDARFIKNYCAVAEFGLVGETMHKVDERVPVSDIAQLETIYAGILSGYFNSFGGKGK